MRNALISNSPLGFFDEAINYVLLRNKFRKNIDSLGFGTRIRSCDLGANIVIGKWADLETVALGNRTVVCNGARISRSRLGSDSMVYAQVVLDRCEVGDYSFVASQTVLTRTKIGKFCSIGPEVRTSSGKHPSRDFVSTHPLLFDQETVRRHLRR